MFYLKSSDIPRLARSNHFILPESGMLFFGLRGCLPVLDNCIEFKEEHPVEVRVFDHIHPSCTIGQYDPDRGIALFPGSTVPSMINIKRALPWQGKGTNMLLTGFYDDYRKGWHKRASPTGHQAFRQDNKLPVRRTADDTSYGNDDRVEYTRPFDNIHAAWCMSVEQENFASAGCQVIVGYPVCRRRTGEDNRQLPEAGPWKTFRENAYALEQASFNYMLLNGRDAYKVSFMRRSRLNSRLRYGSQGDLVKKVQKKLKARNYYEGRIDGDFGTRTLRAVLEFQEAVFGPDGDDGIAGPVTASALGLRWPTV